MCSRLGGTTQRIHRIYHRSLRSMGAEGWGLVLKGSRDSSGDHQAIQARVVWSVCVGPGQQLSRSVASIS